MWGRYGRVGGRDTHGDFDHEGAFLLFEKRAGGEGREHVGNEGGRQGSRSGLLKIVGSRAVMHNDGKVRACRPREWVLEHAGQRRERSRRRMGLNSPSFPTSC